MGSSPQNTADQAMAVPACYHRVLRSGLRA
jgi:hypothetical protein